MFVRKLNELFNTVTINKGKENEYILSNLTWELDQEKDIRGNNQYYILLKDVNKAYDLGSEISSQLQTLDYTKVDLTDSNTYKLSIAEDVLKGCPIMKKSVKVHAEIKSEVS